MKKQIKPKKSNKKKPVKPIKILKKPVVRFGIGFISKKPN